MVIPEGFRNWNILDSLHSTKSCGSMNAFPNVLCILCHRASQSQNTCSASLSSPTRSEKATNKISKSSLYINNKIA